MKWNGNLPSSILGRDQQCTLGVRRCQRSAFFAGHRVWWSGMKAQSVRLHFLDAMRETHCEYVSRLFC
jgi:hypothetical protein